MGVEVAQQPFHGGVAPWLTGPQGEEQGEHDRGKGRVHAGLEDRHPQDHTDGDVRGDGQHPFAVEPEQDRDGHRRHPQRGGRDVGSVEHGNDHDGAQVVYDRQGQEE